MWIMHFPFRPAVWNILLFTLGQLSVAYVTVHENMFGDSLNRYKHCRALHLKKRRLTGLAETILGSGIEGSLASCQ